MTKPYQWRGDVPLKSNDHEFWRLVQKRVAQRWPWEQIAVEIGCHVDDLIHWVNFLYTPPKKPVSTVNYPPVSRAFAESDLPNSAPVMTRQFLAWRKATEGARATREATKA